MKAIKKTALAAAVAALMLLTACTGNTETGGNKTEKGIKITKTAAMTVQTEKYESTDFSITIPKGWKVETGGVNIYHSIRVYDPQEPLNQMFVLLKADVLLHSQKGKEVWQKKYAMGDAQSALFAKAPVLANPSTEGFFGIFPQYAAFAKEAEPTYSGYTFPVFDGFKVTERFASGSGMAAYAMGDELLRAVFSDGSKEGEGMFAASVVDFGSFAISDGTLKNYILQTEDGGYYMAYNIMAITAAKDRFIEWESVLSECMKTLEYSDSFVKATNQASNEKVALAADISRNMNETMNGITDSWEKRNKSQDIISQKQSDATLGYERVYDSETGRIYKATNGFTDAYDEKRYKPVTDDDMYAQPISGYIERTD